MTWKKKNIRKTLFLQRTVCWRFGKNTMGYEKKIKNKTVDK